MLLSTRQIIKQLPLFLQVMLGSLPNDFLRVAPTQAQSQEEADRAAAMHLQQQMIAQSRHSAVGRLQVS